MELNVALKIVCSMGIKKHRNRTVDRSQPQKIL